MFQTERIWHHGKNVKYSYIFFKCSMQLQHVNILYYSVV